MLVCWTKVISLRVETCVQWRKNPLQCHCQMERRVWAWEPDRFRWAGCVVDWPIAQTQEERLRHQRSSRGTDKSLLPVDSFFFQLLYEWVIYSSGNFVFFKKVNRAEFNTLLQQITKLVAQILYHERSNLRNWIKMIMTNVHEENSLLISYDDNDYRFPK